MAVRSVSLLVFVLLFTLLTACGSHPVIVPEQAIYVLSGRSAHDEAHNALTIVDGATWDIVREVALPTSLAFSIDRDPQGRLWIGFNGGIGWVDNRVQVYAPNGDLVQELRPCAQPQTTSFTAGRAFVFCLHNGFFGQIAVIELDTLEVTTVLDVPPLEGATTRSRFSLRDGAAQEGSVSVSGTIPHPTDPNRPGIVGVLLLDPHDLTFLTYTTFTGSVGDIIPFSNHFYLLNRASVDPAQREIGDVGVLDPETRTIMGHLTIAPSPDWGAMADNVLYTYHEQHRSHADFAPPTQLARLDLTTNEATIWDLPDGWGASDMAIIDGQVVLARHLAERMDEADGLYRFDPQTGQTELLVAIPDASGVVAGP